MNNKRMGITCETFHFFTITGKYPCYLRLLKVIGLFLLSSLAVSCSTVKIWDDSGSVRHHFGYVRVVTPPTTSTIGKFQAMEFTTMGLRVDNGLGIGYFHERNEYIPLDCRLVIRVMNEQQLVDVIRNLSFMKKEGLCVTVDSYK